MWYIISMVVLATLFSFKNITSKHNIAERYVFWMLYPVGVIALILAKIFNFRRVALWDRITASMVELYKF